MILVIITVVRAPNEIKVHALGLYSERFADDIFDAWLRKNRLGRNFCRQMHMQGRRDRRSAMVRGCRSRSNSRG